MHRVAWRKGLEPVKRLMWDCIGVTETQTEKQRQRHARKAPSAIRKLRRRGRAGGLCALPFVPSHVVILEKDTQ